MDQFVFVSDIHIHYGLGFISDFEWLLNRFCVFKGKVLYKKNYKNSSKYLGIMYGIGPFLQADSLKEINESLSWRIITNLSIKTL